MWVSPSQKQVSGHLSYNFSHQMIAPNPIYQAAGTGLSQLDWINTWPGGWDGLSSSHWFIGSFTWCPRLIRLVFLSERSKLLSAAAVESVAVNGVDTAIMFGGRLLRVQVLAYLVQKRLKLYPWPWDGLHTVRLPMSTTNDQFPSEELTQRLTEPSRCMSWTRF